MATCHCLGKSCYIYLGGHPVRESVNQILFFSYTGSFGHPPGTEAIEPGARHGGEARLLIGEAPKHMVNSAPVQCRKGNRKIEVGGCRSSLLWGEAGRK
jgi:hypothetical protein